MKTDLSRKSSRWMASLVLGAGLLAATPAVAQAGELDVDLDRLSGELREAGSGWNLNVQYKVEAEDVRPGMAFELLLQFTDNERLLLDEEGGPYTVVVPLNTPNEIDDDEVEFESGLSIDLPWEALENPTGIEVTGVVTLAGQTVQLDRKSAAVDFIAPQAVIAVAPAPVVVARPAPVVVTRAPVIVARPRPTFVVHAGVRVHHDRHVIRTGHSVKRVVRVGHAPRPLPRPVPHHRGSHHSRRVVRVHR